MRDTMGGEEEDERKDTRGGERRVDEDKGLVYDVSQRAIPQKEKKKKQVCHW